MAADLLERNFRSVPLSSPVRNRIWNEIWQKDRDLNGFLDSAKLYDSFFSHYEDLCSSYVADSSNPACIKTHRDFLDIMLLISDASKSREVIFEKLAASGANTDIIQLNITLAVRIRYMVATSYGNINQPRGSALGPAARVPWSSGQLRDAIRAYFDVSNTRVPGIVRFEKSFNAYNLEHFGGLEVVWTSNLADHLRLKDDESKVILFHHATFLKDHRTSSMYPDGFLNETIETLMLLLPQYDDRLCRWYKKQQIELGLDMGAIRCGRLKAEDRQLKRFSFWGERLEVLKVAYDETEPRTIGQWWRDRRKRGQWYAFWVAAWALGLTILFGLIGSIEGGLQVYKAYRPS